MSTPDQAAGPGLTRKQLRELRKKGATPVAKPDAPAPAPVRPPEAHLPRAADPVVTSPPRPDEQVDLGAAPLTRRQAREQERIRTASVPVITPVSAPDAPVEATPAPGPVPSVEATPAPAAPAAAPAPAPRLADEEGPRDGFFTIPTDTDDTHIVEPTDAASDETASATDESSEGESSEGATESAPGARPVVRPEFGGALLGASSAAAPASTGTSLPPSFDELIARGTTSTGSVATSNALILAPTEAPLTAPVASTGEVLITGTFNFPEGLGSLGLSHGATDSGKEADAAIADKELPSSSSPMPIAASAAVSTAKSASEIIRPPAPEKGNTLMLSLAVTAGVLAVAIIGVLVVAFVTGVFS